MDTGISPDILQVITSMGVCGVLLLWLWDVRAQFKEERDKHEQTRQQLRECLRDCNREDETKRFPSTIRDVASKSPQ